MNKKRHLRLVYSKPKMNFWDWLPKIRLIKIEVFQKLYCFRSQEEKAEIIQKDLSAAFGDLDYTTKQVNLFPAIKAKQAVQKMIKNKKLDYYFKKFIKTQFERKKA